MPETPSRSFQSLNYVPRAGSPLARPLSRVQFAETRSRSPSTERLDMPLVSPKGLPPQGRLSSRRGSMAAVDPWGQHYAEDSKPRTSTSRLTIVRVPSTVVDEEIHAPSPGPYGGSSSFRERSHQRRSSWGANSGASSDGEEPGPGGRKRSRMSFAFSSFTPISPTPTPARQATPTSSGPAQGRARTRSTGSSGVDLLLNPTQDRSGARPPQLTPQQLYELAMASRDPAAPTTPLQGVISKVEPAHFTALPQGEILPFLDRPAEVDALINTPGTQSHKLFALLGALFPRSKPDDPVPKPLWPPFPGEEDALSPPVQLQPSSKAAPAQHPLGLPSQPTRWSYAQLVTHLTQTTREQLPDKEWVLFARACIRARSEALWERVKGSLGVPSDIYEDDQDVEDDDEDDAVHPVGISELANMSPVVGLRGLRDAEHGSEHANSDEEHEPEAWVEPVFPTGPGSARGSVSNSPTHYFSANQPVTGLGGGRGDTKSWTGSVSGRSDGGRMELIGEEEEEEEEGEQKSPAAEKTPEPESPVVGLRIMTSPMSPGFHPTAHPVGSSAGTGTGTGDNTPSAVAAGSGTTSPAGPASPTPSIHQFLGPPLPNKNHGGAWISPLSNTISTGGTRGLSGLGGRSGAGWNSPTPGGGGWNSPLGRRASRGSRGEAWNPVTERSPGNPIFPSSFARLSLGPTLSANNPSLRSPAPAHPSAYPPFRYLRERYKWAKPASENDFAITIASESSDAGRY
ncbi:hypothetical protein CTheo_5130 [Ceratobasidium theobromae]|uniref:Uncharacterized protein n=1 Tax=Ceratobasidium theobromae TaxID=1582974 RepID=A0A5N5QIR3_9AGAM|nr:hypothetical protein CTheo_5130 [Ceratobasidium theobromae]